MATVHSTDPAAPAPHPVPLVPLGTLRTRKIEARPSYHESQKAKSAAVRAEIKALMLEHVLRFPCPHAMPITANEIRAKLAHLGLTRVIVLKHMATLRSEIESVRRAGPCEIDFACGTNGEVTP